MEEQFGAIWVPPDRSDKYLAKVRYFPAEDLLGVVWHRSDGLFRAACFEKKKSPQWRLPFWSEMDGAALLGSEEEAEQHLDRLIKANRPPGCL